MIEPTLSRIFIRWLLIAAAVWIAFGMGLFYSSTEDLWTFLQVFWVCFLDLIFLILIFWKLFFANAETIEAKRARVVQIMIFIFFKLVCLGFLAIVLKRLRNASLLAILLGIGFIGFGPIVAGVVTRRSASKKQNIEG